MHVLDSLQHLRSNNQQMLQQEHLNYEEMDCCVLKKTKRKKKRESMKKVIIWKDIVRLNRIEIFFLYSPKQKNFYLFSVINPFGCRIIKTYTLNVTNAVSMASMRSPWYHIVPLLSIGVPMGESAASGILNTRISEQRVAPKNCATQYIAACSRRISSNKYLEKQTEEERRRVY